MERRLRLEGVKNCRELGGLRTADGRFVRRGLLLRTGNLSAATAEDLRCLREDWRLSLLLDLRTETERRQRPDRTIEGLRLLNCPIFEEEAVGITREKETKHEELTPDMPALYRHMVSAPGCRRALGTALGAILGHDPAEGAVLWHCTAGKDRCGLISALLLGLLGVPEEEIAADYLLSNETCLPEAEEARRRLLEAGRPADFAAAVWAAFQAREEFLEAALACIRDSWGAYEAYALDGLGLSREQIARFRERALTSEAPSDRESERKA